MNNNKPLVSICCITYNHENFIRSTIEGFLSQVTSFTYEIIIHDDASNDSTAEIIKEYASRHPGIIRTILQQENQFSKGVSPLIKFVFPIVIGKYFAICEGDDYWTDNHKLQKQVDFMENHPEYGLCVAGYKRVVETTGEDKDILIKSGNENSGHQGFTFSLNDMLSTWYTKTLTALIRTSVYERIDFSVYRYFRDIHLFHHLVKNSKAYYITQVVGVYRVHEGGINSMKHGKINSNNAYLCYKELFEYNRDEISRIKCRRSTLALLNYNLFNKYPGNTINENLRLFYEGVKLTRKISEIRFLFTAFLRPEVKHQFRDLL